LPLRVQKLICAWTTGVMKLVMIVKANTNIRDNSSLFLMIASTPYSVSIRGYSMPDEHPAYCRNIVK